MVKIVTGSDRDNTPASGTTGDINSNTAAYGTIYPDGSYSSINNPNGASIYGTPLEKEGETAARNNAQNYYGTYQSLGQNASDYRARLKAKVDQPSGLANQMMQSANQEISRSNAKAGMAGVDTSARNIASRRDAQTRADAAQQSQDQINLANYGKSIGAGISGTEALAAAGAGRGTASTPTPTPSYGGGIFGSIICTELYKQKKLTLKELAGSREFRETLSDETYEGYLTIAKPIVVLMKKSDKFSNLFIGWAKSISRGEKNKVTRFMIPICSLIGKIKMEFKYVKRA